jgi:hypothetical protein
MAKKVAFVLDKYAATGPNEVGQDVVLGSRRHSDFFTNTVRNLDK